MKFFQIKFFTVALILSSATFFSACFDEYSEENQRKRCNATPCTEKECLHWDSFLKRCGTHYALLNEAKHLSPEEYKRRLDNLDSLRRMQIKNLEKHIQLSDSLSSILTMRLEEYKKKDAHIDSLIRNMNLVHFCESAQKRGSAYYWLHSSIIKDICE